MREVGKMLKQGAWRFLGCSDRMGRLRQLGVQKAGTIDKSEKGEIERSGVGGGWQAEKRKRGWGCFKVSGTDYPWKAINLP